MTKRQSCLVDLLIIIAVILVLYLTGCASQQQYKTVTVAVPPSPILPAYETNLTIPVFRLNAIVAPLPQITNAISLGWDISKSDLGFTVYLIYGKHNVNAPQWTYVGATSGLVCTITNINLAPQSVFKVVASNTYTHITSDMLVKQIQQVGH